MKGKDEDKGRGQRIRIGNPTVFASIFLSLEGLSSHDGCFF
jgi:hypothetical protein